MSLADKWAAATAGEIGLSYVAMFVVGVAKLYLVGCVFFLVERIRPTVPGQKFFKTDFITELAYPLFNSAFTTPVFTVVSILLSSYVLEPWVPKHVFGEQIAALPFVVQVLFVMLVADVGVYLEHWFAHKVLWDYHALHHVTPEVSWLTHARVHPVNGLTIAASSLVVHFVFGVDGTATVVAGSLVLAISIWEHANMDFAWPKPFCYLLVSPRFHRWHHSSDAAAIDKNFCLVFPFLDLLMGTYYCPDRMPSAYGVHRDSPADQAIPETFVNQMLYPFARMVERFRPARTATGQAVAAPDPREP
jgi:sterol desaturase/sphingolipid hydroxylase (fatty acid hydroxylase superfamily)